MVRKKSRPTRISSHGSTVYLGHRGEIAAKVQAERKRRAEEEAKAKEQAEAEEDNNSWASAADSSSRAVALTTTKKVRFADNDDDTSSELGDGDLQITRLELEPIPPPEIEFIIHEEFTDGNEEEETEGQAEDMVMGMATPILRYNYHPPNHTVTNTDMITETIFLRQFTLDGDLLLESTAPCGCCGTDSNAEAAAPKLPFQIRTTGGAKQLLQFCFATAAQVDVHKKKNKKKEQQQPELNTMMNNVALAVELGMMSLTIGCGCSNSSNNDDQKEEEDTSLQQQQSVVHNENNQHQQQCNRYHYEVSLSLTQHAFLICNPQVLFVQATKNSKSYRDSLVLKRALAELLPKSSEMFPMAAQAAATAKLHPHQTTTTTITAKQVYALVDNVQIRAHLNKKKPPSPSADSTTGGQAMTIPGLVPTLRPYQEAAVQWMLQRERQQQQQQDTATSVVGPEEWELAWIIIVSSAKSKSKSKWRVHFLPEYTKHMPSSAKQSNNNKKHKKQSKRKSHKQQFLYCPFTNWLATSIEDAKDMTMRTSISRMDNQQQEQLLLDSNDISSSSIIATPRGGILAESMGLGKTVEMLACILANPDPLYEKKNKVLVSSQSQSSQIQTMDEEQQQQQREDTAATTTQAIRTVSPSSSVAAVSTIEEEGESIAMAVETKEDKNNENKNKRRKRTSRQTSSSLSALLQNDDDDHPPAKRNIMATTIEEESVVVETPKEDNNMSPTNNNSNNNKRRRKSSHRRTSSSTSPPPAKRNIQAALEQEEPRQISARTRSKTKKNTTSTALTTGGRVSPTDSSSLSAPSDDNNNDSPTNTTNVVPPDLDLEDHWIDSKRKEGYELGSCICGKSIALFASSPSLPSVLEKDSIVICEGCREPMHWKCAAFGIEERQQLSHFKKGILYRQKFSHDSFWCRFCPAKYCPCCVANDIAARKSFQKKKNNNNIKFRSRGTIIVTPPAILGQWEREVSHHTLGTLQVVVYKGVRSLCNQYQQHGGGGADNDDRCRLLHPRFLADADIVLMTFDTLHQDLGHSDSNPFAGNGRSTLRKRKRYRVVPSPLSSITWWRVCLDEAQRVETPTVGSAQMALKLDTSHRWCVSGTPIGRGKLDDLYGLLLFLRLTPPFNNKYWFRQCFGSFANDDYMKKRLRHLLGAVFWRSTKSLESVANQLGVPPQIENRTVLKFSSVERHFYNRQVDETMQMIGDLDGKKKLSGRKRKGDKSIELLEGQLGRLRAACCHPQVGSSGLAVSKKSRKGGAAGRGSQGGGGGGGGGLKVLSMDQILDRLIDDARNKCEEALRVSLFHTNPMATIARLKIQARRDHPEIEAIKESDEVLIAQSCKLYQEAIELADENAAPSLIREEVLGSGSQGFQSSGQKVRGGTVILGWRLQQATRAHNEDQGAGGGGANPWACLEYDGNGKKMRQIRVKALRELPMHLALKVESSTWSLRHPRICILQVSNAAVGGEFVDILRIEIPRPEPQEDPENEWATHVALPIYKSKTWRIVVDSFYPDTSSSETKVKGGSGTEGEAKAEYAALEVELYEPSIGFDSLQRLHTLHNAIISFEQLDAVQRNKEPQRKKDQTTKLPLQLSTDEISKRVGSMEEESAKIEAYNLEYAKNIQRECTRRLKSLTSTRQKLELDLPKLGGGKKKGGFWDVAWWDDIVAAVTMYGSPEEQHSLCEKVQEAIDGCDTYGFGDGDWFKTFASDAAAVHHRQNTATKPSKESMSFPKFRDIQGLAVAMKVRFDDEFLSAIRGGRYHECIMSVLTLSPNPTNAELLANQTCHRCKADWGQTGPMCSHCKVEQKLIVLHFDTQKLARFVFDAIWKWAKSNRNGVRNSSTVRTSIESGAKFFEILAVARKEVIAAYRVWRQHLGLLNVMDELHSTKTPMRLAHDGEDLSELTEEQRGAVIYPFDVCAKYHEHEAKQATALATLRQEQHNLTFLKNQITQQKSKGESCIVCLSTFTSDRAVLACGHSFHPPCLEFLKSKQGSSTHIRCPLRCKTRTRCDCVMIASDRRNDDGSKGKSNVKGDYGTKVNALVGDLLVVSDKGEKSVVFSMWEDMLDILEEALNTNGLKFVRASSLSKIGASTKRFRSSDCFVLLLNVKNGAEGLNLIEATHVFMIEPLLNCGLDSQAIARVHRIGQTQQTYVHRYLIEETCEVKIDRYRSEHQEDQLEDSLMDSRKCAIQAGGIDGGFSSKEELLDLLQPPKKEELIDVCC